MLGATTNLYISGADYNPLYWVSRPYFLLILCLSQRKGKQKFLSLVYFMTTVLLQVREGKC